MAFHQFIDVNDGRFPRSTHSAVAFREMPWGYAVAPWLETKAMLPNGSPSREFFSGVYLCPDDDRDQKYERQLWSYGKSVWFELQPSETGPAFGTLEGPTFERLKDVSATSRTILAADLESGSAGDHMMAHFWEFGGKSEVAANRHADVANYLWVDGHVTAETFATTFDKNQKVDRWNPQFAAEP